MFEFKRVLVILCTLPAILFSCISAQGETSRRPIEVHKVYVGSFGSDPGAAYLRSRLLSQLARTGSLVVVDNAADADLLLNGKATLRIVGYYNSNPRIRYRNSASVAVYDAKVSLAIADGHGRCVWSGTLKPRFWGSQYVSDNVVNQAARHVIDVLRQRENDRHSPPDC